MRDYHGIGIGCINVVLHAAGTVTTGPHAGRKAPHTIRCVLHIGYQVTGSSRGIHIRHLYTGITQIQVLQNLYLVIFSDADNGSNPCRIRRPDDVGQLLTIHCHVLGIQHKEVKPCQSQQLWHSGIRQLDKGSNGTLAVFDFLF